MNPDEMKNKISTDPQFVCLKRFSYSLDAVLERYPDGCPNRIISQALCIPEESVEDYYKEVVLKLRGLIGIDDSLL